MAHTATSAIAPAPAHAHEPAPAPVPEGLCLSCRCYVYFTELAYAGVSIVCATHIWFISLLAVCRPAVQHIFSENLLTLNSVTLAPFLRLCNVYLVISLRWRFLRRL